MKCARCGNDSKRTERVNKRCPKCKGLFAFDPAEGAKVTDQLFQNAIDAVSGKGRVKWGVEHLHYEINRRKRGRRMPAYYSIPLLLAGLGLLGLFFWVFGGGGGKGFPLKPLGSPLGLPLGAAALFFSIRSLLPTPFIAIEADEFNRYWSAWRKTHGTPKTVIARQPEIDEMHREARKGGLAQPVRLAGFGKRAKSGAPAEADIADYSFDRAVICDRARTVDLLIANNFHFENNCAILSIDGYPENVFETVRAMIKRNPKLHVFTLHDATAEGCAVAEKIAHAPEWFDGKILVVDLGLRPRHAGPFQGLLLRSAASAARPGPGIDAKEAKWLSQYTLELAAIRPEDVIKRLFRGIKAHDNDDTSGGGTSNCGSFDSGPSSGSRDDSDGADSFG